MLEFHRKTGVQWLAASLLVVGATCAVGQQQPSLQQKLQWLQQAAARSEQQLHAYQWLESTTLTINGSVKPAKQAMCSYGPDGRLQKTPLGAQAAPQMSGGLIKQHIIRKKIEEFQEEMGAVTALTGLYLPLDKPRLEQALHTRRIDLERDGTGGSSIVINDYAKPGDQLRITLNLQTLQIEKIQVNTYFASPADILTAEIRFAQLSDKTVYPAMTAIGAVGRKIFITTVDSDFSKPAS